GKRYEWESSATWTNEAAPAPQWLLDLLPKDGGKKTRAQLTDEELEKYREPPLGQNAIREKLANVKRNPRTKELAEKILAGAALAPDGMRDHELARAAGLLRTIAPDDDPEVLVKVAGAACDATEAVAPFKQPARVNLLEKIIRITPLT